MNIKICDHFDLCLLRTNNQHFPGRSEKMEKALENYMYFLAFSNFPSQLIEFATDGITYNNKTSDSLFLLFYLKKWN